MARDTALRRFFLALAAAALLVQLGCSDEATRPDAGLLAAGALASKAPGLPGSPPLLVWTPGDQDDGFEFEGVMFGEKTTREFTLTNAGGSASGALTIDWAGATSFRVTRDGCGRASLPPGRSCTVDVEFNPQVIGHEQVDLIASGQRREALTQLSLHGEGLEPRLQQDGVTWIKGDGSVTHPYWIENPDCDGSGVCVSRFSPRYTTSSWGGSVAIQNYVCGRTGARYLVDRVLVPFGTFVPRGVAIEGLGPVAVSIPHPYVGSPVSVHVCDLVSCRDIDFRWARGTYALGAQATNWSSQRQSYRVVLHCTDSREEGYTASWPFGVEPPGANTGF